MRTAYDGAKEAVRGEAVRIRAGIEDYKRRRESEAAAQAAAQTEEQALLPGDEAQAVSEPVYQDELVYADPTITELVSEDGREYLTGGNVRLVYYNQGDDQWKDQLFGRDPIGPYGCGPTALAMAVSSLTDQTVNPAELAAWAGSAGYAAPRSGSYLSIVDGAAEHYGLSCTSVQTRDVTALLELLSSGGVMVALLGPGHFTGTGHFILLHGVTLSGEILVADPSSRDKSLVTWDAQLILDELSRSTSDGAPLWHLRRAESGLAPLVPPSAASARPVQ